MRKRLSQGGVKKKQNKKKNIRAIYVCVLSEKKKGSLQEFFFQLGSRGKREMKGASQERKKGKRNKGGQQSISDSTSPTGERRKSGE